MATGTPMASIPGEPTELEDWKYKFSAYMGLQDPFYPRMLDKAATANQHLAEGDLQRHQHANSKAHTPL